MKIPVELPQFTNEKALIAVLGSSEGVIYEAVDGTIGRVVTVEEPKVTYSDREGFFLRSGHGLRYGSGSVYEDHKEETASRFRKKAGLELRRAAETGVADRIYILNTGYDGSILEHLPVALRRRTVEIGSGNFVNEPPVAILRRIKDAIAPETDYAAPSSVSGARRGREVRKILERTKEARRITRGR